MRVPPWILLLVGTVAIIVVAVGATFAFGGDDDNGAVTAGTPVPTRTTSDSFGAAPVMTAHITQIIPSHAGQLQQRATLPSARGDVSGICAVVNYTDVPGNNTWFRMAVDDAEVTERLTLILKGTQADPEGATMCYAPPGGLTVGVHSAALVMQDPRDTSGVAKELVAWKFEVIP